MEQGASLGAMVTHGVVNELITANEAGLFSFKKHWSLKPSFSDRCKPEEAATNS